MDTRTRLEIDQGADFSTPLLLNAADGTPLNVVGYTFTSQAKLSHYKTNVAANLVITALDAANGNLVLSINAASTANMAAGRYVFDVMMKDRANLSSRLVDGLLIVSPSVTNITPPNEGVPAL